MVSCSLLLVHAKKEKERERRQSLVCIRFSTCYINVVDGLLFFSSARASSFMLLLPYTTRLSSVIRRQKHLPLSTLCRRRRSESAHITLYIRPMAAAVAKRHSVRVLRFRACPC